MDGTQVLLDQPPYTEDCQGHNGQQRQPHPYPTRSANATAPASYFEPHKPEPLEPLAPRSGDLPSSRLATGWPSTIKMPPKTVNFQLQLSHMPQHRARLPLRVHIQPHDTTESIITTVKNFYGLYEGEGVSFHDVAGDILIARYENLSNNSIVYVRVMPEEPSPVTAAQKTGREANSPLKPHLDEPFQMSPPQPYSRPNSRAMKTRDISPQSGRGYTGASVKVQAAPKPRNPYDELEVAHGMSDSDGGSVSVSSSRRDHLASAEISLDNIVEGGRRKKAKFESSELPLFAPPQQPMTASMSSLSPQRRFPHNSIRSPLSFSKQYTFSYNPMLPSPQSLGQPAYATPKTSNAGSGYLGVQPAQPAQPAKGAQPHSHRLRGREPGACGPSRLSGGSGAGVLPTPDPTIGSVISDEDVALQLMRLGDPSNQSYGRTSTSTLDDALSGKAEVASSAEGSSDDAEPSHIQPYPNGTSNHHAGPARKKHKSSATMLPRYSSEESSCDELDDQMNGSFQKPRPGKSSKAHASSKGVSKSRSKSGTSVKAPASPYSMAPVSRKESSASSSAYQQQLGEGEEDLSAKPRCQRCRKSKKGCDRQRPCQRCKDAGIGIEGCVSEDEGNGRKGRFGRHMGVPIKKNAAEDPISPASMSALAQDTYINDAYGIGVGDNSKKRKR